MTAQEELGTIQINPDVIATISLMAAKEVAGIITGGSSLHDFINPRKKGIEVNTEDDNYAVIDIEVNVEYGIDVYKASHQLQRAVRNAVESMTGKPVKAVNVKIKGIVEGRGGKPPSKVVMDN